MKNLLSGLMNGLTGATAVEASEPPVGGTKVDLLADVEHARQQWLNAKAYFEYATDPDLIDMAIYTIDAAEKRYIHLLKEARVRGIRLDSPCEGAQ